MSDIVVFTILGYNMTLLPAFLGFFWLVYAWETYLDVRQHRTIKRSSSPPSELATMITLDEFKKSKEYALDKDRFSFVHGAYDMIIGTATLYFYVIPWLWTKVTEHAPLYNGYVYRATNIDAHIDSKSEIACSLIFLFYVSVFKFFESLPWSLYYTFVLEERHGFNKQTLAFFFKDQIKTFFISILIFFPVVSLLIWIIRAGGAYFYLYAYIFALIVTLFMMFIYPEFIAPLFDRYEPLPDGDLRRKIEKLADQINFPLKKLLVVEGSKRSAHSNAYFYGFWKNKRIVLYDTLIRDFEFSGSRTDTEVRQSASSRGCAVDEEIVAVLGHELGHWKCGHALCNLIISQINLLLMFVVFSFLMNVEGIFSSFGFTGDVPVLLRLLVIFQFIFSPYNTVVAFLMTVLSRQFEFQADDFAINLGYGSFLKSALIVLHKDNLSFPISDWLYSMFNHSHPPIIERLTAIDVALLKRN